MPAPHWWPEDDASAHPARYDRDLAFGIFDQAMCTPTNKEAHALAEKLKE